MHQRDFEKLIVETDFAKYNAKLHTIKGEEDTNHPSFPMIMDRRKVMETRNAIKHILHEGNFCSCFLAKMCKDQAILFVILKKPPY